jgi:hypothetical protein
MPDQDAVLAITAGVMNMQAVLDLVWAHLLPGMTHGQLPDADSSETAQGERRLATRLRRLAFAPPAAMPASPLAAQVSGTRYLFPANDQEIKAITVEFMPDGRAMLGIEQGRRKARIRVGSGKWQRGQTRFGQAPWIRPARPVMAAGGWTAQDTYVAQLLLYTTPFTPTFTLRFVDDRLLFASHTNASFGPLDPPQLVGTAA